MKRSLSLFLLNAAWLIASAYFTAPFACEGGLALYASFGVAALLVQGSLSYAMSAGLPIAHRLALSIVTVLLTIMVWFYGLFAANIRILCRMI